MSTSKTKYYKTLFLIAAIYDIVLGIVFTFCHDWAFQLLGIGDQMPPGPYVALIGAFLLVIGIAYAFIYLGDLQRNRDLIAVGALYKLAYSGVALVYLIAGQVPHMAFVFVFGLADLVFFLLMVECWLFLGRQTGAEQ